MPLSKTDPSRYPDAATFASIAAVVSQKFEPFEHTFETKGEAANFSQRFYTYRKAVIHRRDELEAKLRAAQISKDQVKKALTFTDRDNAELTRMRTQAGNMQDIIIKRPTETTVIVTSLVFAEDKWHKATEGFLAKHMDEGLDIG